MSIVITSVPPSTRKPGAYFDINTKAAKLGLPVTPDKLLLVGHKHASGSATADVAVQIFSAGDASEYFGAGSPLAHMAEMVLAQNPYIAELWAIPLQEAGAGVAATATLNVATTTVEAGAVTVSIGGRSISVAVAETATATQIAVSINAAINAEADLPFTSAVNGGDDTQLDLTAKVKGTAGNDWVIATEYSSSGVVVAPIQPSGGASDADIQDALDAAHPVQYDVICAEFNDDTSLDALGDHFDDVAGPMEQRPGVGIAGVTGTLATNTTLSAGRNHGRLSLIYLRGTATHPMELAAAYAAALVAESDRARPLNTVELTEVLPPDNPADLLTRTEQESCLLNGLAPLMIGPANAVQIVRSVTTYVENALGSPDDTLLDLQTLRTLDYVREAIRVKVAVELAQVKIADEAVTPNTTDPTKIRSLILGVLYQLQNELGYLERVETWEDRLVVERDGAVAGRVNATIPADIVDGLHVFAASIDLILG